ncbi:putative small secreted protein [Ensifer adhaerens]|uniref:Small secreted protein n=1 Tax=Ensifer adhaerens TaxID=106592 RepID=A0ACC5T221_ENSAD|nr:entericidin [Ensifer adhaerens]MBP1874961.1 putative small secreted protein [Ensifer adhaerens]
MSKATIAFVCLALLSLSACGNTMRGFQKDSTETGLAVDNATHRVLKAGAR